MSDSESDKAVVSPEEFFSNHNIPDASSSGEQDDGPLIEAWKPSEFANWVIPEGHKILGDCHITRGEIFVIGGTQGVGKSKATAGLAVCGATGEDWMGRAVHSKFKTLIIQNENGPLRLKDELSAIIREVDVDLDDWIRITPPPPEGLGFQDSRFRDELISILEAFSPDVIIIDPWNAVAVDNNQKAYVEAFRFVKAACMRSANPPAIGIVAHLNKPNVNDKGGRGGMHRLSGSYILASIPRCVFILDNASDDETDDNVILYCPKNNNGRNGKRSAWLRTEGLYQPVDKFDWDEYDARDGEGSSRGRKAKHTDEDFVSLLPPKGLTNTEWADLAIDALSVSKSTFDRKVRLLVQRGVVHKSEVLGRYQPIKEGDL